MRNFPTLAIALISLGCAVADGGQSSTGNRAKDEDLAKIELPPGFEISYYSDDVPNARSMVLSDSGVLFVGTRNSEVYAVVDDDNDLKADRTLTIASGLRSPNGVALRDGSLYVAEISRILRYDDIENHLEDPPEPVVVKDDLPTEGHHGWKYIAFGPDGKLYIPIGAPCNICDPDEPFAAIWRMNPDASGFEEYAAGVRNSVGFDWHPETGELWFTDNGRDMLGDNVPNDELNYAPEKGLHFGYPYFHEGTVPDPEFGDGKNASDYCGPAQKMGPHVAALGVEFYTGDQFPSEYRNQMFIAQHGSWNRSQKIGYRVMLVRLNGTSEVADYQEFATGWLQGQENWGRPVDLELLSDGSLLVSDDQNGAVYRIRYTGG